MSILDEFLNDPKIQAEAVIFGLLTLVVGVVGLRMSNICESAKSECGQVLDIAHRIPGVG